MLRDVRNYIGHCRACLSCKTPRTFKMGLPTPILPAISPGDSVSLDLLSGLPLIADCCWYLLVVVDRFSGLLLISPFDHVPSSREKFNFACEKLKIYFGRLPATLLSDRGPQFVSSEWRRLWASEGVNVRLTSSYHPEGNGLAERMVETVIESLRVNCIARSSTNWLSEIKNVCYSIYNSPIMPHGFTPFEIAFGYTPESHMGPERGLNFSVRDMWSKVYKTHQ
jgi:transposase InsO family protein